MMKLPSTSLARLVGPTLLERFPALRKIRGYAELPTSSNVKIQTDPWRCDALSGLREISLHFADDIIEVACGYRNQVEEFTFVTADAEEEKIAGTLARFMDLLLVLPTGSLGGKNRIRDVLDYSTCKGIY